MKLEKCIHQLNAMSLRVFTPEQERCKYACTDYVKATCPYYKPYNPRYELPMKGLLYIPRILEEMRREK